MTYGQAQKWLNMTIKYLYCLQYNKFKKAFHYLHVPIDNRIIKSAYKDFKIAKPVESWSKWNKEEYTNYQEKLIKAIGDKKDPLRWEFTAWLNGVSD